MIKWLKKLKMFSWVDCDEANWRLLERNEVAMWNSSESCLLKKNRVVDFLMSFFLYYTRGLKVYDDPTFAYGPKLVYKAHCG